MVVFPVPGEPVITTILPASIYNVLPPWLAYIIKQRFPARAHTACLKRELGFGVLRKLVEDNVLGFFSKSPLSAEHALGSFSFKLLVIEIRIVAAQGHQLLMGALLNNLTAPHHQD